MTQDFESMAARHFEYGRCRLAYWTAGSGAPVLLVQGTGVHGAGWMPQVEALSDDYECVWFDNRGMFASRPAGDRPITVEQMADDCRALLDHLGHGEAHIVGHSLGGCIALQTALSWPERVRSLSLLCTAAEGPELVKMDAAMIWRGLRIQIGTKRSRRRAFMEIVLSPGERDEVDVDAMAIELAEIFGHDLAVSPPGTMKQVGAMRRWDVSDRLGELAEVPTLVCGAAHDPIARPRLIEALAAGIPGARLEMFQDCAHGMTVTGAERLNEVLRTHFGAVESGGGS